MPEVISDGVTGFIVDDLDSSVEAVQRLGELDRHAVRQAFDDRFTVESHGARLHGPVRPSRGNRTSTGRVAVPVMGDRASV